MIRIFICTLLLMMATTSYADGPIKKNLPKYLQDVSVTINAGKFTQGSGTVVTRQLKTTEKSTETINVNFVVTAAHVVDNLRNTRTIIDSKTGLKKEIVEFRDAAIVKELVENGRRVGELKMDAKVIKFSDAHNGEDLALLMIRKTDFISASAIFYTDDPGIVPIGTHLYHVGSLQGQVGANSMTSGIMSQVGRVVILGNGAGTIFDQTTVTAFPGSSGGGVFFTETAQDHAGECIGLLTRGTGETFNLIVPVRRILRWSKSANVEWAFNKSVDPPSLDKLVQESIEDPGADFSIKKLQTEANMQAGLRYLTWDERTEKGFMPTDHR